MMLFFCCLFVCLLLHCRHASETNALSGYGPFLMSLVTRSKARLRCTKLARACRDSVVRAVAYATKPHFRSR